MSKRNFGAIAAGGGALLAASGTVAANADVPYGGTAALTGLALVGGTAAVRAVRRNSTAGQIERWNRRTVRSGGTATLYHHMRTSSSLARLSHATRLRPSLSQLSSWERFRLPATDYAVLLGTAGVRTLYASIEDTVLRVAGPRSGKTTAMAARILDAPGGVIVTSTRVDLLKTLPLRAERGPCWTYDPGGVSGTGSSLKWSPLVGCTDPAVAAQRAADMMPPSASGEGQRWDVQASRVLGVLMHAAALADLSMTAVVRWLAADGDQLAAARQQVDRALTRSTMAGSFRMTARQYYDTVDRTRSSIVTTAMPVLAWLNDERAAAIGDCQVADSMDLGDLIDGQGTLYILGTNTGSTAPLTSALVAEIVRQATVRAERRGGRLDPPLTFVLDEAAKVAPGPLHQWTADGGGRGVLFDLAFQSLAAIREVWGEHAASMILSNSNVVLLGAGCKDPADLAHWEALTGVREREVITRDDKGNVTARTTQLVPVVSRDQIHDLPKGTVVAYGLGGVTILRTPDTWRRRKVRRSLKAAAKADALRETDYRHRPDTVPSDEEGK